MKELILIAFYWLHLLAAVIWIGGIVFILFVAIPSVKNFPGEEAGRLMKEISKKFTPLANYSIIILIISGIVLTGLNKHFSGITVFGNNWILVLTLKHILVFTMVVVHFYRNLVLIPKIGRISSPNKKTSLQKLSLNLVKVNFIFGTIVLLLSGVAHIF